MNALPLGRMELGVLVAGTAVFLTRQKQKKQSSATKQDGLKQKQNLGGAVPKRMTRRFKAGWPPAIVDGFWGYRICNWLTWFEPGKGWQWLYQPKV